MHGILKNERIKRNTQRGTYKEDKTCKTCVKDDSNLKQNKFLPNANIKPIINFFNTNDKKKLF